MRIAVYAKAGVTIGANRLVCLTGRRSGPGWEIDLPSAADRRAHAIALPAPKAINDTKPDVITDKQWGQAETFGPIVEVEMSGAVDLDDEVCTGMDGRAYRAAASSKHRNGIALGKRSAGEVCPIMLGWLRQP